VVRYYLDAPDAVFMAQHRTPVGMVILQVERG
jgi:hypothetical protein